MASKAFVTIPLHRRVAEWKRAIFSQSCPRHQPSKSNAPAMVMSRRQRRAENVPGNVFVDTSCIDCDTCRWLAPEIFHASNGQSAVHHQPNNESEEIAAQRAAAACPTGSIRSEKPSKAARIAISSFPLPVSQIPGSPSVPDIYYIGFASEYTFGGASWLVIQKGLNPCAIMFDCARFFRPLAKRILDLTQEVGGVKYIVLSHKDDVAGHSEWAKALGAKRVIHEKECNSWQGTVDCEIQLKDEDFPYNLEDDVKLLHVPGHTVGSIVMLHQQSKSLFTGDHIAYSARRGRITGFQEYANSWSALTQSVQMLKDVQFLHAWPGHGRHFHFTDDENRKTVIDQTVAYMQSLNVRASR